ncbi:MAG: Uma2 family endonuclease [Tepidisphaerales bacterium]
MTTLTRPITSALNPQYSNAAEWWDSLANVPLERIIFHARPGTATDEDVLRLDDREGRICELIDGTLVEKPMGIRESAIAAEILRQVANFVVPRKLGIVTGEAGMLRIRPDRVRAPDVAFISFDRLAGGKLPDKRIPDLAPDLAAEVLSDSNTVAEMNNKLPEYFEAGVRLVWYADPRTRTVDVYSSPENPRRLTEADALDGGNVLPGFEMRVADIFRAV